MEHTAKAEKVVYAELHGAAGCVPNPRDIQFFTEDDTEQSYQVIRYDESASDLVTWKWFCEATRQAYPAAPAQ